MSWASGSSLISNIIEALDASEFDFDFENKKEFFKVLIEAFEDRDCDTTNECLGEDTAFDEAYYEVFPERKEEDNNEDWDGNGN
jgi:hypothetical protein